MAKTTVLSKKEQRIENARTQEIYGRMAQQEVLDIDRTVDFLDKLLTNSHIKNQSKT